jgi:rhodanese-related sulfurtransferase
MIIRKRLLAALFLIGWLAACGGQPVAPVVAPEVGVKVQVDGGAYTRATVAQLNEMLKQKDFFFVNVHIPYEGEIEPTDAQIPYDQTAQRLSQYPADKNAKIVLYCLSSGMSKTAAAELVKAGYTNVWNLDGGMIEWEKQGLPIKRQ